MIDRIRLGSTSGFVSVALWIIVFTPQIWECYVLRSGEGLSVTFLLIWLTGDIMGLVGAVLQKLTPTISLLALYYSCCDILLLYMLFYYRKQRRDHPELFAKSAGSGIQARRSSDSERAPLLNDGTSHTRHSEYDKDEHASLSFSEKVRRWARTHVESIIAYSLAFAFIITVGIIAWFSTAHHPKEVPKPDETWATSGQVIGWVSAALYLGSRIPQIQKNRRTKCQGLSLMMFCFSVLGNVTYCGSILFPSTDPAHVYINFSWLVGSAGTIFLDFIVLGQFVYYREDRQAHVYIQGGESQISGI